MVADLYSASTYPWSNGPMSEPMYMYGDPIALSDDYDNVREFDCDCGWIGEVGVTENYSHGIVTYYAEWKCPSCGESHTKEGDYDPRADEDWD